MRKYGLIGYPLSHSFSPKYFDNKFKREGIKNTCYDLYPIEKIALINNLKMEELSGLNVTIPYKEAVIPFLDEISDEAKAIGAVNTIKFDNGKLIGYNTDVYGFRISLEKLLNNSKINGALILGTGGAAKAVAYVLEYLEIPYLYVSRSKGDIKYHEVDKELIEAHHLIINTTPLGMSPNIDACPAIPYEHMSEEHFAYDLVYNPEKTLFLNNSHDNGASILNGLSMLELQAERSWEIWNDL